jgi:hypothetical protein
VQRRSSRPPADPRLLGRETSVAFAARSASGLNTVPSSATNRAMAWQFNADGLRLGRRSEMFVKGLKSRASSESTTHVVGLSSGSLQFPS